MSKRAAGALARPGEAQEALDRAVEALALLEQDLEQLALRRVGRRRAGEHLHRAGDGGQRVADLVGEAGGELAHRGHAVLDAAAPPAAARHCGEVLEDDDVAAVACRRRR